MSRFLNHLTELIDRFTELLAQFARKNEFTEHVRGGREAVEQQQRGSVGQSSFPEKDIEPVDINSSIAGSHDLRLSRQITQLKPAGATPACDDFFNFAGLWLTCLEGQRESALLVS